MVNLGAFVHKRTKPIKFYYSSGKNYIFRNATFITSARNQSTLSSPEDLSSTVNFAAERYQAFRRSQRISKAMAAYIKQTEDTKAMLQKETEEFELGKRHLANMMGLNPETMTQQDIDEAIQYLLPSGLFSPRSRPTMKPPTYYYPSLKPAQFSADGRPFDTFFYTANPRFYGHLYDLYEKWENLEKEKLKQKSTNDAYEETNTKPIVLVGTRWLNSKELSERFVEKITENQARQFEAAMDHLNSHPLAYLESDFLLSFRVEIVSKASSAIEFPTEIQTDELGRSYVEAVGRRKLCDATVKVYSEGTGKISIEGRDITQFEFQDSREQIMHPFLLLDRWNQFDVVATLEVHAKSGESAKAGAVRLGISKALCPFLTDREREKLKFAGLLTRDPRRRERNKYQHIGARAMPTWKKR